MGTLWALAALLGLVLWTRVRIAGVALELTRLELEREGREERDDHGGGLPDGRGGRTGRGGRDPGANGKAKNLPEVEG